MRYVAALLTILSLPVFADSCADALVVVQENLSGKFHLHRFGRAQGGETGERPFTLSVRDRAGVELWRIDDVRAADLGVGAKGHHYAANTYFISDVFRWDEERRTLVTAHRGRARLLGRATGADPASLVNVPPRPRPALALSAWERPSDDEIRASFALIAPYVRFIHPKVIEAIVGQNAALEPILLELERQGIRRANYFWEGAPVLFPGVRRHKGNSDEGLKRRMVPLDQRAEKQAVYIDDNSYPKQLWSFVLTGAPYRKINPEGYDLAHLFHHKADSDQTAEIVRAAGDTDALSGFFTHGVACAYVPREFARATDLNVRARKLLQRKVVELYEGVCTPLPPGVTLDARDGDWQIEEFKWAEPVGEDADVRAFLEFRRSELGRLVRGGI